MRAMDALLRRAFDVVVAGVVSAITAPVVGLLALAVRLRPLRRPGPVHDPLLLPPLGTHSLPGGGNHRP